MTETPHISENTDNIVLVVDDSPDSLGMLNSALSDSDFTVLVALNGLQALSILEKVKPNIVLMDAIMPDLDGFQTCKIIKQKLPDVPVIFMTGLSDLEHIVAGFDAGGVDYVTKPIKPQEVIARIRVHISNARLTHSARQALDTTGQHILSIDSIGNILWATKHAKELLEDLSIKEKLNESFTTALQEWISSLDKDKDLVLEQYEKPIKVTYIGQQNEFEHLIKIKLDHTEYTAETLLRNLPITKREADVLLWLSLGKTNWEIAQILKISPRTVNKHLEQIFRKMNVDNRTSAAAMAIKVLNPD